MQQMILEDGTSIILIHFTFLSPRKLLKEGRVTDGPDLTWKIACRPFIVQIPQGEHGAVPYLRSEEPRAVTCPHCKGSSEWQQAMQR